MTLLPHQAFVALKRERAARGKRAPPELSIVDGFCRQPSPVYGADSVGQAACPLVLAAAGASPAALRGDARSDSTHATTPDGCIVFFPRLPVSSHRAPASERRCNKE